MNALGSRPASVSVSIKNAPRLHIAPLAAVSIEAYQSCVLTVHERRAAELHAALLMMRLGASLLAINQAPVSFVAIVAPTAGGVA